ncbi:hypothetical protein U5N28_17360 [Lysinibacillus telephonicus]|uniref:Uncharacterized protein n=1 Tax=Lysinibacillus telephonicus TaxID=1714840 RepID=A0A3S0JTW9_9BACI|nr:hypothetical protein [Lysinibacillus telephonicus]RTQ95584.1 hypothetical protein EKG35_02565 [Lysinibacillus telephonicus]
MGTILLMVALFVISSLLSGNKKTKQQKPMPPFNNKPNTQMFDQPKQKETGRTTTKSLEDFASEIFQKLSDTTNTQTSGKAKEKLEDAKSHNSFNEVESNQTRSVTRPTLDVNRSVRSTKEAPSNHSLDKIKQKEIGSIVPTTREALVQAIITTEILGPPKAKQR